MKVHDKNLVVASKLEEKDIKFYNVKEKPFAIYGLYDKEIGKQFTRMNLEVAEKVSPGVLHCSYLTSGARIRFKTDSEYVAVVIKTEIENEDWPQMSGTATCGLDMYELIDGKQEFAGTFIPPLYSKGKFEQIIKFIKPGMHDVTINMPIYGRVGEMYIGLQETARLEEGSKYINTLPVLFYGSSIVQGGCMSRPGMIYLNQLSRKYNIDTYNLGFGGNAKGEIEIAEYVANHPMSIFVYDYDYNSPSDEHLLETHERMFKIVREKNPDIPVIIMSGVSGRDYEQRARRQKIIKKTYDNAINSGDKNVYFIDGLTVFSRYGFGWNEPTLEGCHPTDLGFTLMAAAVSEVIDENKLLERLK